MKIIITRNDARRHCGTKFFTQIADYPEAIGRGDSEKEAMGDLVKNYPHLLNIEIERNKENPKGELP